MNFIGRNYNRVFFSVCIIHFLSIISNNYIHAQKKDLRFEHISVEQGLSQSCVSSIIQDNTGYLWIATSDGLNRYDGYDITIYRHNPADSTTISDNSVETLFLDSKNNLWIGTAKGGLNKYDYNTGKFKHFKLNEDNSNLIFGIRINTICEDKNRKLWIGTNYGLYKFDPAKNEFVTYFVDPQNKYTQSFNYIKKVFIDSDEIMWVATAVGLHKFDPKTGLFYKYFDNVFTVYEDKEGILWLGTFSKGLIRFNKKTNEHQYYKYNPNDPNSISNNNVRYTYEDHCGNIWVGTIKGLNRLNKKTNSFIRYLHKSEDYNSLNSDEHYCIYEDREGIIWFGTYGGGLNKLSLTQEAFLHYKHYPNEPGSLSDNFVSGICEDKDGNLWVSTDIGGLNKLDRKTNKFIDYTHDPGNKYSISSNTILTVNCDYSGNIWVGMFFGGVNKFDTKTKKFSSFCFDPLGSPSCLGSDIITSILHDGDSIVWIGGKDGLDKLDKRTNTFTHYKHDPASSNSISDNRISALYMDKSGILWIATVMGGLNKFNPKTGIFKSYKYDFKSSNSICSNYIMTVFEDTTKDEQILWLGTENGLNRFNKVKEEFIRYSVADGLPNDCVYDIVPDNNGNLWLSTNNGLSKFNPETKKFINYSVKDGLQGNEFNHNACFKDKKGNIYFGGMNGFNVFHPDNLKENTYKPRIALTSFKKFNKEVKFEKAFSELEKIDLTYKDYVFSFEFAALSFTRPEKNQYAYKLEGFDDGWIYTDAKRRFATYTNLIPGEYTFRVKGSNNDGIWNEEGVSVLIVIYPPFWQTWWFRAIILLSFIGFVFFIVWYTQTRKLKRKIEKLQQQQVVYNERARISKDMHDEVGSSLTKIHLIAGILTNAKISNKETKERIEKVHVFSQEVIQKLDEIVWTVSPKNDNLKNLINYICEYVEEFLSLTDIANRFDIPGDIPDYTLTSEQRYNIFLVVKEGLNNIVKYSEATLVMLKFKLEREGFIIELEDNGIGFELNESKGCGNGLRNMKERIDKIGGRFEINSGKGKGTRMMIKIFNMSEKILINQRSKN